MKAFSTIEWDGLVKVTVDVPYLEQICKPTVSTHWQYYVRISDHLTVIVF